MRTSLLAGSALLLSMSATQVMAQDSAGTSNAVYDAEQVPGDIIVSAQRRSESLQKVPVSLTAVTAESLESRRISDLTQIARAAPSLQVGGDNTFAVRRVGTLAFAGTIDSSVALSLDEVNLGRPFLGGSLFNEKAEKCRI
jgi:iron complex outermembrane recepter protein